ncbi:uncharacterized protein LACBIDRAFT_308427 [Laccaria bicolor S238N-H82]|uniref:Predicted protein n=1 Tax=Laccaria bicolor (strain S238N-H82 / ATCC MYA-4686) TaxID=486041 RepID=B0CW96_LACBS|nr:uncharacterized protein LACBIDRAFT_308427 [Laccaria bicolor S238N-H82]EDR13470.1 predicted protein [Laccaria bicolor S238N-H82]|eukprot:XP_001875968.1 predicted protein [Laccaria bicolor S238N-H82]
MPEDGEVSVVIHQVFNKIKAEAKKLGTTPLAYIRLFSRCFTLGTKNKPYSSISVHNSRYTESLEPMDDYVPNHFDLQRASRQPWAYLVNRRLSSGQICLARRGKCLAIGVGYHLTVFHLGLEAKVTIMSHADYTKLIENDCPGSNPDRTKASRMRSFVTPPQFIEPGSSSKAKRTINVFAAIVADTFAIVFSDFARLMHMHVISKDQHWTQADLDVGSLEWPLIWTTFPDGPDWVLEREAALIALDNWRDGHLANDFLHYAAIFPGAPCSWICSDDIRFERFKQQILKYTEIWRSPEFLRRCAMSTNSPNPFAFNTTSDRNYTNGYIWVFRKAAVDIPCDLYNFYLQEGLFDKSHTIGEPYHFQGKLCDKKFKSQVPVYYHSHLDAFTVITAKVPDDWKDGPVEHFIDLRDAGYTTTVGPAQFFESKQNKIDPAHALKVCIRRGRPAKISDGLGRKRKTPTYQSLEKMQPSKRRRTSLEHCADKENTEQPLTSSDTTTLPPRRSIRSHKI